MSTVYSAAASVIGCTDTKTWPSATATPAGAALTRDDVAGKHVLAAENLQPEPLAVRVAAVAG